MVKPIGCLRLRRKDTNTSELIFTFGCGNEVELWRPCIDFRDQEYDPDAIDYDQEEDDCPVGIIYFNLLDKERSIDVGLMQGLCGIEELSLLHTKCNAIDLALASCRQQIEEILKS